MGGCGCVVWKQNGGAFGGRTDNGATNQQHRLTGAHADDAKVPVTHGLLFAAGVSVGVVVRRRGGW